MNSEVLAAKESAVKEIVEGLKSSAAVVVVSYQGLTVANLEELRKTLRKSDASFGVYKNTLVKRALNEVGAPALDDILEGPNAVVFSKEVNKGTKDVVKFAKFHEELVVKGGLIEGKAATKEDIVTVSKLPDRNGLISMFLSCLNAPVQKFAATVKAVADKAGAAAPSAN